MTIVPRWNWRSFLLLFVLLIAGLVIFQVLRKPVYRVFGDFMRPYVAIPAGAENWISESADQLQSRESLILQNRALKKENDKLKTKLFDYETLKTQYASLRQSVGLPDLPNFTYVVGQIVVRDPTAWDTTFTLNVGGNKGIEPGFPVLILAPQKMGPETVEHLVLIGRVESVSRHSAIIHTLYHPHSNLSVYLPASRLPGMLRGSDYVNDERLLSLQYLPRSPNLSEDEPIYTSGASPFTPEGLLVGYLSKGEDGALTCKNSNLNSSAWVRSAADISYLRYVVIPVPEKTAK